MAAACPNINQEQINDLLQAVKEGLLAFSVTVGLNVIKVMMKEEVTKYVGPKGKHNSERKTYRHGKEQGQVVLGGRKVKIEHPRVRTICKQLLTDLVDRGLCSDKGLLVIIDGSKALRTAVRDIFGQKALVQRCQVHKKRNVLDHLPENQHDWVKRKLDKAWSMEDASRAEKELKAWANELQKDYPGAAASLLEGLEETLTVKRLRLSDLLTRTLSSTNPIESAFDIVRSLSRNIKR